MATTALDRGFLDALFGDWPVGLALLDRDRRFVRVNDAMSRITLTPVEAHLGRTVSEVLPGFADQIDPVLVRAMAERSAPIGQRVQALGRSWHVSLVPIVADGDAIGVAVYALDVTGEVEATEALEQQTAVVCDDIVQSLVAAVFAREVGREDLLDRHLQKALESARRLVTNNAHRLLPIGAL